MLHELWTCFLHHVGLIGHYPGRGVLCLDPANTLVPQCNHPGGEVLMKRRRTLQQSDRVRPGAVPPHWSIALICHQLICASHLISKAVWSRSASVCFHRALGGALPALWDTHE